MQPTWLDLIIQTFQTYLIWPFANDMLATAMIVFAVGNKWMIILASALGALAASTVNFGLGYGLYYIRQDGIIKMSDERYNKWQQRVQRFVPWIGMLVWLPFMTFPIMMLAFFQVQLQRMAFWMLIGWVGYYWYHAATKMGAALI